MASNYTYDQFEQEAKKAGLFDSFSTADLNLSRSNPDAGMSILKYKQDWAGATNDQARALANAGAESIRSRYGGYSGGGSGTGFSVSPAGSNYTYSQFEQAAKGAGLYDSFSTADLNLALKNPDAGMSILKYKQDYASAANDEARALANAGAESIRSSYGNYTGGADGGSFHLEQMSPGSFAGGTAPTYENQYADKQKELLDAIVNRQQFSYDPAKDPVAQAYQKQYAREGQRATQDTLAAAASASGGLPSSYAATAAGQAGDYYASQMADKIPELYQQAYNRYLNEYSMKQSDLSAVQNAEQLDYSKYLNKLNQFNTDRNFNYGQHIDEINNQAQGRQEALEKALLAAQQGDYSFLKEMGIDTSNNPELWEKAMTAAQYGDYSMLQALGVDTSNNPELWEKAMTAAQYGDYSMLQALGVDTSKNPADWERNYQMALLAAEMGDYSKLNNLGINTSNNSTDWERKYQIAVLKAQYGDLSGLRELGVNTGGSSTGSYSSSGSSSGNGKDYSTGASSSTGSSSGSGSGTGMNIGAVNQLWSQYGSGKIPAGDVASIRQKYGVSNEDLANAGFTITGSTNKTGAQNLTK